MKTFNKKLYRQLAWPVAILLALYAGLSEASFLQTLGLVVSDIFIKLFKCISLPIISLSIIVTFSRFRADQVAKTIARRILFYTLGTTLVAASLSCLLYLLLAPEPMMTPSGAAAIPLSPAVLTKGGYLDYLSGIVPDNLIKPFVDHQVMTVLLLSIVTGLAIRFIPEESPRQAVSHFFQGLHGIFLVITGWIVKWIPLALFGFVTTSLVQFKSDMDLGGLGKYLMVIVLANVIQGVVVLPCLLLFHKIRPFVTLRKMLPALSMAFFSKSSAGTLPVTMKTVERNLGVSPKIAELVLPLCTTINMNGCAAFIFATVMFVMHSSGVTVDLPLMLLWIPIATLAAIGNAGVPMGCFFLSASLLSSLNVPITLLGLILPFYSVIDMLETALNVWSDVCITTVLDGSARESGIAPVSFPACDEPA